MNQLHPELRSIIYSQLTDYSSILYLLEVDTKEEARILHSITTLTDFDELTLDEIKIFPNLTRCEVAILLTSEDPLETFCSIAKLGHLIVKITFFPITEDSIINFLDYTYKGIEDLSDKYIDIRNIANQSVLLLDHGVAKFNSILNSGWVLTKLNAAHCLQGLEVRYLYCDLSIFRNFTELTSVKISGYNSISTVGNLIILPTLETIEINYPVSIKEIEEFCRTLEITTSRPHLKNLVVPFSVKKVLQIMSFLPNVTKYYLVYPLFEENQADLAQLLSTDCNFNIELLSPDYQIPGNSRITYNQVFLK